MKIPALLLYPCTLIAYVRIGLLVVAVMFLQCEAGAVPDVFLRGLAIGLLAISCLLDAVDGYLARRFGHVTIIGAVLDQSIDLAIQSVLWIYSGFVLALPLMFLECLAAVLALKRVISGGADWKSAMPLRAPIDLINRLAAYYFSRRQRNPLSMMANMSHTVFPMALILGPDWFWLAYLALPGLLIFMLATTFIVLVLWRNRPSACSSWGRMQ